MYLHKIAVVVAATALLAGCGGSDVDSRVNGTTTAPTSAGRGVDSEGPRSTLAPALVLPAGTLASGGSQTPGVEVWAVPTNYDYTVQYLRDQLPVERPYDGLPWCSQDINHKLGTTQLSWGGVDQMLVISASRSGSVTITRGPDAVGC